MSRRTKPRQLPGTRIDVVAKAQALIDSCTHVWIGRGAQEPNCTINAKALFDLRDALVALKTRSELKSAATRAKKPATGEL